MSPSHQKTMMQVKATPTLCRVQIGCQWVGVLGLIFHRTLIIHQKVKGKEMMNFKCRQENLCCKDKLVSFPCSELSLSSPDSVLVAFTGPVCLYQHLTAIFLPHTHNNTHANICSDEFVHHYTHLFSTTLGQHSAPVSLSASLSHSSRFSIPLCICTCNQQIYLAEAWWEGEGWAEKS